LTQTVKPVSGKSETPMLGGNLHFNNPTPWVLAEASLKCCLCHASHGIIKREFFSSLRVFLIFISELSATGNRKTLINYEITYDPRHPRCPLSKGQGGQYTVPRWPSLNDVKDLCFKYISLKIVTSS